MRHVSSLDPLQGVTTTLYVGTASAPFASITILPLAGDFDGDGIPNGVEIAEGRDPLVKDNDVFSPTLASARLFAMQQYRDFVNREADPFGLDFWSNAVFTGTWTRPAVIDAFLNSQEFAGFVAPVVRLYFATFLRVPDYAGLTYNAGLVSNGTVTLTQLADFFTASPEFAALYGALDNTQFVTLLYANVLGRVPDPAGLSGWVALLNGGYTRRAGAAGLLGLRRVPGGDGERGVRDDDVFGDASPHGGAYGLHRLAEFPRRGHFHARAGDQRVLPLDRVPRALPALKRAPSGPSPGREGWG